jgi:hypothetical protein
MKRLLLPTLFGLTSSVLISTVLISSALASKPIPENTATMLGKALVNDAKAWCEFEVWGREGNSLFVWALCEARSGTTVSAPAAVSVKADKAIKVKLPRDGSNYAQDLKSLFPEAVQQRIIKQEFDVKAALERIAKRKANQ